MKKIFAIALAVVMVLSIASVASAFTWAKPADSTPADYGYTIDVIKYTRMTGEIGSYSMQANDAATAVNNAPVYFAVKLDVTDDEYRADTAITLSASGLDMSFGRVRVPAGTGTFYLVRSGDGYAFTKVEDMTARQTPFIETTCLDTDTAKVSAKVAIERPFGAGNWFQAGDYSVEVTDTTVTFSKTAGEYVRFVRNSDGLVTSVDTNLTNPQDLITLYAWLNNGDADSIKAAIANKEMYMTNPNLYAAFGYSYSQSDSITWQANSVPIILDPTVSIPKTGDNASVIGFAMIMVAVVAAAVAVRKVNA